MDIITKINNTIDVEVEFARQVNPIMALGMNRVKELINGDEIAKNKGLISDGYHTFDELYYHRMVLFSIICNTYKEYAWKSWLHDDGTMYDDYFIVGVTTELGDYSYHYDKIYWDVFMVKELEKAPKWDGHKPSDINRLNWLLFTK